MAEWLRGLGPAFRDNHVDGEVLRRLTTEDLRELGVASIGHRRRLLDAVAALAGGQPAAEMFKEILMLIARLRAPPAPA